MEKQIKLYSSIGHEYKTASEILISYFEIDNKYSSHKLGLVLRPFYFCASLAIELYLKGYLFIEYSKKIQGHNLDDLMKESDKIKDFFQFSEQDEKIIKLLNKTYYKSPEFGDYNLRYPNPEIDFTNHPDPHNLMNLLKKMQDKLDIAILDI